MACDLPWNVRAALHAVWRAVRRDGAPDAAVLNLKPLPLRTLRELDPRLCVMVASFGEWQLARVRPGAQAAAQTEDLAELVQHICQQITGQDAPPPPTLAAAPGGPPTPSPRRQAVSIVRDIAKDFNRDREAGAKIIDFKSRAAGDHLGDED